MMRTPPAIALAIAAGNHDKANDVLEALFQVGVDVNQKIAEITINHAEVKQQANV